MFLWFQIEAQYENSPKKFEISDDLVVSEFKYMLIEGTLDPNERAVVATSLIDDTKDSDLCSPDEPMVTPDFVGSGGAGSSRSPDTISVRRVYSTSKILGARCYARWQRNGNYYWGYIQQVTGHGLTRRYSVSAW
jgi:hypothetical protein